MRIQHVAKSRARPRRHLPIAVIVLTFSAGAILTSADAGETAEWNGITFVTSEPRYVLESDDGPDAAPILTVRHGLAFNQRGTLFIDIALQHTVNFSNGLANSGVRLFTLRGGDQLLVYYTATDIEPTEMFGIWSFLGGSGRYEGISGEGRFTTERNSTLGAVMDVFEGTYEVRGYAEDQFGRFADKLPITSNFGDLTNRPPLPE